MRDNLQRIRVFCRLLGRQSPQHNRLGPAQAWRVAGISTGKIVAMPDDMIEWWWKLQDVISPDATLEQKKQSAAGGR